jgi:hypothetical protein
MSLFAFIGKLDTERAFFRNPPIRVHDTRPVRTSINTGFATDTKCTVHKNNAVCSLICSVRWAYTDTLRGLAVVANMGHIIHLGFRESTRGTKALYPCPIFANFNIILNLAGNYT